jgi:hypothetical protein
MTRFDVRGALIASIGCALMFAGVYPTTVKAQQSAVAGQGTIAPSGRAPMVLEPGPSPITPEELGRRQEMLNQTHLPGPPLPAEPGFTPRSPALPGATPGPASQAEPQLAPAPNTFTRFRAQQQNPFYAGGKSTINEPSVGSVGPVVFVTSNWDAAYSNDGGQTFNFVNPYNTFPSLDGGFCCDQTVIYDRARDVFAWQLLYLYSATTQKGSYRLAFAQSSQVASGGWCYYDFNPQSFGLSTGLWLDYPNVAISNNYIWYSANVFNASNAWQTTVIWRIPLDPVLTCSGFTFNYFIQAHFQFTLAQGATTTMYWESHNSTSSIRVYHWDESSNTIFWNDIAVTTFFGGITCASPDNKNWCGRADTSHGATGWVANGVLGFMWNSGPGGSFSNTNIRVARINPSTMALIDEPAIFNNAAGNSFIYPSVGVNNRGHIAGTFYFGSGSFYPYFGQFIWDDFTSPTPPACGCWEVYYQVQSGSDASALNAWGDFYNTRRHGSYGNTWVAAGETLLANGTVQTVYTWFGRQRDNPVVWSSHDFNDDAISDVLWRDNNSGGVAMWLMSGASVLSSLGVASVPNSWQIVGQREFNGDGYADILWRDSGGGVAMSLMNGGTILTSQGLGNVPNNWIIAGTGDFNGDGFGDILWRDTTSGGVAVWFMIGTSVIGSQGIGNVSTNWVVAGTGDFNGDGKWDILWRDNNSGGVARWLMNGATVTSSLGLGNLPLNWVVTGIGDFNGDLVSDVLWRDNNSGGVAMWLMRNGAVLSSLAVSNVPTNWQIVVTGDFNLDGMSDVLWRDNNSGGVAMWLMSGASVLSSLGVGNVPTNWQIQGVNAD